MSRMLVTGGAGFIGSHLVERLLRDGHQVTALDCFDDLYPRATKEAQLREVIDHPHLRFAEVDLRDAAALEKTWADAAPETVFHLAARAGVRPSIENPRPYFEMNVVGTANVLEAARRLGAPRLIFASSSSVYGEQPRTPFAEDDPTDRPISPYAAGKKMGEQLCHAYCHAYGLAISCLRFFSVYGPRCRSDMAVAKFTEAIEDGQVVTMYGDGGSARDYTYIDDIIEGMIAAARRCDGYGIYNLGRSEPVALRDLIEAVASALGKPARIEQLPPKPGDVPRTCADISRSRAVLGYQPRISLAQGLALYVEWFRRQRREQTASAAQPPHNQAHAVVAAHAGAGPVGDRHISDRHVGDRPVAKGHASEMSSPETGVAPRAESSRAESSRPTPVTSAEAAHAL